TRLKTSRPNSSVPIQCSPDGDLRRPRRFSSSYPAGAILGAKSAISVKSAIRPKPIRALTFRQNRLTAIRSADRSARRIAGCVARLGVADSGVEESIQDVHTQVDEHEHQREQEDP